MKQPRGYGSDNCPPATRDKIADAQRGDRGYQWRGEHVGYSGIHKRARAALPRACALADATCIGQLEVALRHDAAGPLREDRRGMYSPHLEDYWRLCRSHHNRYDGKQPPPGTWLRRTKRAVARA